MEKVLEALGDPGRYHVLIACMFAITWWSVALGTISMAFYGSTPNFTCNVPTDLVHSNVTPYQLAENSSQFSVHMPISQWNISVAEDQCSYSLTNGSSTLSIHECQSWTYEDAGRGTSTVATEWNLVCSDSYKTSLSSTLFFVGVFCGALIFGFVSDQLGRKKTLAFCLYTHVPISLAIAFMPDYVSFTALRFLLGIWLQGISTVAFVHCIEFFRQRYRGVVMVGFGMSWAFAQLLTTLVAYLLPNWRHMQGVAAALPLVTLPYFWWLPESPRWLMVKGRFEEILKVFLHRAAKMNKVNGKMEWFKQQLGEINKQQLLVASTEQAQSFINILRSGPLLKRLLAMCYSWCVASMTYYMFIFNTKNLAGNMYLNFAIGAALEIVVNFCTIFLMITFGRRRPLLVCCFILGVFCIISGAIPKTCGGIDIGWLVTVFSLLGRMAIAAVMCLIFVYAAELFPTFARGSCIALCGCSLRIGGMLAPQIIYLGKIVSPEFPFIIVAVMIILCGVLTIFLPETFGKTLPNTIAEALEMEKEVEQEIGDSSLMKSAISKDVSDSETSSNSAEFEKLTANCDSKC